MGRTSGTDAGGVGMGGGPESSERKKEAHAHEYSTFLPLEF